MKSQLVPFAFAALSAAVSAGAAAASEKPLVLHDVAGSPVKRIVLTEKAMQRLGIETGQVREEVVVQKQMVGGVVTVAAQVSPADAAPKPEGGGFGGFAPVARAAGNKDFTPSGAKPPVAPNGPDAWVLLSLSHGEWERLAKDRPARLLPLATRASPGKEIIARPSGMAPVEDGKRSMLRVYYVVPGADHGLQPNTRMRVELQLDGPADKKKVVPYSALYYDAKGTPWVYLNPEKLTYQRTRVGVERIAGDIAVLSEGPEAGATIVTVGAPLLYGTEIFKK